MDEDFVTTTNQQRKHETHYSNTNKGPAVLVSFLGKQQTHFFPSPWSWTDKKTAVNLISFFLYIKLLQLEGMMMKQII